MYLQNSENGFYFKNVSVVFCNALIEVEPGQPRFHLRSFGSQHIASVHGEMLLKYLK